MVRHRRPEYDAADGINGTYRTYETCTSHQCRLLMKSFANQPLTIAIPFYKGQAYLRLAIESVLRQSSSDWRLIVCDDGPEPGTAEVVAAFADPRIRYLKNERNLGMAGNWNR